MGKQTSNPAIPTTAPNVTVAMCAACTSTTTAKPISNINPGGTCHGCQTVSASGSNDYGSSAMTSPTIAIESFPTFTGNVDPTGAASATTKTETETDTATVEEATPTLHTYGYRSAPTPSTTSTSTSGSSRIAVMAGVAFGFVAMFGMMLW